MSSIGPATRKIRMQILDESHNIIKTQAVIEHLHGLVLADAAITSVVSKIEPEPQTWGSSGLHFSARLRKSAEPVLIKLNVPRDQLWWTRSLAQSHPELIPRVFAAGADVGGERLGWVIWERGQEGLHPGWRGREFDML